jgi:hypothetical protein
MILRMIGWNLGSEDSKGDYLPKRVANELGVDIWRLSEEQDKTSRWQTRNASREW